jgi:two-component system response regulator FlrC
VARILVVDDEEGVRSFLADALVVDGHDVEQAEDGDDAWRKLAARPFQVLVTDLKMPRRDGMDLLRQVRRDLPQVEVIVLTAHGSVGGAVEAMKLGAFDYLEKPLRSPGELRELVARALSRRGPAEAREKARPATQAVRLSWGAPAMAAVEAALGKVAPTDATVLLLGESGTGKEVAARWIHAHSRRASGPFVAVNCATLSEQLLESDLFGHEKGAFTGAVARRPGKIEQAEGGTFFLDEVGELRPELQTKLLRVLQERRFERVGGTSTLEADVRWIAATNRDLVTEMQAGRFREDLFHRLSVFPIRMPPLRDRREDVLPLAQALLERVARDLGRPGLSLDEGARAAILALPWPGNVRALANALERAAILAEGTTITADVVRQAEGVARGGKVEAKGAGVEAPTMEEAEQTAIRKALELFDGNRRRAADHLGIGLRTLYEKLKRYGIK